MKKRKFFKIIICFLCAFALGVTGIGLQTISAIGSDNASVRNTYPSINPSIQDLGVVRPEDIDEGLSVKSLNDIRGRRVTVRQPIMEVLDYEVPRPDPKNVKVLGDTYEFLDLQTETKIHKLAEVTFDGTLGDLEHPKYPMVGLKNSPKDKDEQTYFSSFKKYALLRQAYYFNLHAQEIVDNDELYKHPAADYIYGEIPQTAKAVEMRIVTDPIYRSPMTTGLYLVPGEVATITIKGLKKGSKLNLYTHHQDTMGYKGYDEKNNDCFKTMEQYFQYWDNKIIARANAAQAENKQPNFEEDHYGLQGQWKWQNQKVPCMSTKFEFVGDGEDVMTVKIGSMYGGPLYFQPTDTPVEMIIKGAVLTPHFVLGVTKIEDFEEHYKNAPGLIATLDCENGQLIGPAQDMRNCDDMEKLAYFWHSVFAIDISLNGRAYNYNMTMCYDIHVPAGEAVALNSNFCAQPTYWFDTCMNYEELTTKGNWGTFHELGHTQAATYGVNWGFAEGDGEVWNNTLILIIYSLLCNMDTRFTYVEHGEFVHPYTAVERSLKITKTYTDKENSSIVHEINDYGQINNGNGAHFDQLSMYSTLLHSFGPEKFIDMFYTYKLNQKYCDNKRADFVYRIGLVDRVNITKWVNENYFANIKNEYFTSDQLAFLNSLPDFYPIAYRWANGIDGNETARKYEVDGKFPSVFDLSGDNILSYKEFKIEDVTQPKYGETHYDPVKKKVTYQPPHEVTEYDSFDIIVSTLGGRKVSLNVNLKLLYRGTYVQVWDLGTKTEPVLNSIKPTLEAARNYAEDHDPTGYEESAIAGKNDFKHENIEYFLMKFKYVASATGMHTFYLRADDASCVQFFDEGETKNPKGTMSTTTDKQDFSDSDPSRKLEIYLTEGQRLDVVAELVNWGGLGHLHIGVKMPTEEEEAKLVEVPTGNIVNAGVTNSDLEKADSFKGWQPQFVDSIKDVTMDSNPDREGWAVLEAPQEESGYGKENLIDNDEESFYHSHYSGNSRPQMPQVFVFDMKEAQRINYFEIFRRSKATEKITQFDLYGMKDCVYDQETMGGENYTLWEKLSECTVDNPDSQRYRVTFDEDSFRYLKLVILGNSENTVIKEGYAGLTTNRNKNFEENSANGKLTTKTLGATFEFEFLGSSFEIYSDTGIGYGSANVYVDGENEVKGVINLNDDKVNFNKCVYRSGALNMGVHKVKIVTTSENPFNISFINVIYGTPVDEGEYPALQKENGQDDFGDEEVDRQFSREWKTLVKDYQEITSLKFLKSKPENYEDTFIRIDTYIRIYRDKNDSKKLAIVYPGKILAPIECGSLFAGCSSLTEIDFTNFDTSQVRGATSMFNGCTSIKDIDLSTVQTANIQSLGKMFANCIELENVDLTGLNLLENVNVYCMFDNCFKLDTITFPEHFTGSAKFQFPYVYQDMSTHKFYTEITLDSTTAGHTFKVHNEHSFTKSDAHHKRVEPKCIEEGSVEYYVCDDCSFKFDEAQRTRLLTDEQIIIPATEHRPILDMSKTRIPTCTEGGGTTIICENCHTVLGVEADQPPEGHLYELDKTKEEGKGYKFETNEDGTATLYVHLHCMALDFNGFDFETMTGEIPCDHEETLVIKLQPVVTEATCEAAQYYTYNFVLTKELCMNFLNPEEKEIADEISVFSTISINETIAGQEALGHEYSGTWGQWLKEGENYTCSLEFVCEREGCEHHSTVKIVANAVKTDATCETDGNIVYTASFEAPQSNDIYDMKNYVQTKTEIIERFKHHYVPAQTTPLEWFKESDRVIYTKALLHLKCTKCQEDKEVEIVSKQEISGSNMCGQNATSITYTVNTSLFDTIAEIKLQIGDNTFDETAVKQLDNLTYHESNSKIYHMWKLEQCDWSISHDKSSATLAALLKCERCNKQISVIFNGERSCIDATCESAEQITFTLNTKNSDEVYRAALASSHEGIDIDEKDGFTIIPGQQEIVVGRDALGHDFTGECKNFDETSHIIKCIRCDTYSEPIEHEYIASWTWSEYNNGNPTTEATLRCEDCQHQIRQTEITVEKDGERSFEASCTKEGSAQYYASFEYNGKTFTSEPQHYYLEKIGHEYAAIWEWGELNNGVPSLQVTLKCDRCQSNLEGENLLAIATENTTRSIQASCTQEGLLVFNATLEYNGKIYKTPEEKEYVVAKSEHQYHVVSVNWAENYLDTTVDAECSECKTKLEDVTLSYEKKGDAYSITVKFGDETLKFADGVEAIHIYEGSSSTIIICVSVAAGVAVISVALIVVAILVSKKRRKKFDKN